MGGLYIHIPFCRKACVYCDFHFSVSLENKKKLIDTICKEIILRKDYLADKNLNSIYFGGGTPSLLTGSELENILTTIRSNFFVEEKAEITFELNPEDADLNYLKEIK